MLQNYNPLLEPQNWRDHVEFNRNASCVFVVYPAGASGDLLASIINTHYCNTGADYLGLSDVGQVIFRSSDYKIFHGQSSDILNLDQWVYDINGSLSKRNIHYSNIDCMIFSNHWHKPNDIQQILCCLPNSKVIKIYAQNNFEESLIKYQSAVKNKNKDSTINFENFSKFDLGDLKNTDRTLYVSYASLFSESEFEQTYSNIVDFLQLKDKLIRFSFIKYYLQKQSEYFQQKLNEYFEIVHQQS